jgi:hypothetical protein
MFVIYTGRDEIIVTTPGKEASMLREYFASGMGRDLDDYDREEENGANCHGVTFQAQLRRQW